MRTSIAVALLALIPLAAAAVPGGHRCQVAESVVPTPGLRELAAGSQTVAVPEKVRLTDPQVEKLAALDSKFRKILEDVDARFARLPAGSKVADRAALERQPLPELVAHFLAGAARDQALVVDVESAHEFQLANAGALAAQEHGDKSKFCPLCLAVRRGMEADFAWKSGELGALSPDQAKEAAELAALRGKVRSQWAAAVKSELDAAQLTWLREAQMRWLKSTLHSSVTSGMRGLGAKKCDACATALESKCEFCSIVLGAVDEAKSKA